MAKLAAQKNGWQSCALSEVINLIGGGTPKTTVAEYWSGDIPWLSVADFNNGKKFVFDSDKKITEEGLRNSSTKLLNKGDIIISARGTVGVIAMIGRSMAFNQSCYGIRAKEFLAINDYVYYLLKNTVDTFLQKSHGGVFDTITQSTFREIEIELPSLPEQKAIAEVLSSLDDKIDLLHRQNKTLEDMAQALFRKWFVEEASEEWEENPLGEMVGIAIGRTPPRKEFEWFSKNPENWKWISIKDMGESGVYIFNTSEYLTHEAVNKFKIPVIPENTVILSFKMTVGRVSITTEKMLSNEAIAHFKFNSQTPFSKEYLYLYLKTFKFDLLGSTSSIVISINSAMIKKMLIMIPDHKTMNKFKQVSNPLFKKIFFNQSQIRILENLRDILLPKLMSGVVRIIF